MSDRIQKLAHSIVTYSCNVQPGEKILIEYQGDTSRPLARAIIREVYAANGLPFVNHIDMTAQLPASTSAIRRSPSLPPGPLRSRPARSMWT